MLFRSGKNTIDNEFSEDRITTTNTTNINAGLVIGYFFSYYFGFETGIEFHQYKPKISLKKYQTSIADIPDNDENNDDVFESRVFIKDYEEIMNISYICIPFLVQGRYQLSSKLYAKIGAGAVIGFSFKNSSQSIGIYTYTAYYDEYNIELSDIENHGLCTDKKIETNHNPELFSTNLSLQVSLGFTYQISNHIGFSLHAKMNRGISNISNYDNSVFHLSKQFGDYQSLMSSSSDTKTNSSVVGIGIRYTFR